MQQSLKQFVQDNPKLVTMRESKTYPGLFVLKYTKRVFYDSLWNDFLEECRGTIVDADFNVVARPFQKIYNYGVEEKAPVLSDDTPVTAYRKVNGFMVAMTWYDGDILVSTTGSTESDFTVMAKEIMLQHQCWIDWQFELQATAGMTLMFECCHRNDPHIVVEKEGLYFLGFRENKWDSKITMFGKDVADWAGAYATQHLKCGYAEALHVTLGELKKMAAECKSEGFVFYTEDGVSAKIKSPHYLCLKWVARNPRTDKLLTQAFKEQIDEEYYPLIAHIRENIVEYTALTEQERLAWVRKYLEMA